MSPRLQTLAGVVVYVATIAALVVLLMQDRPVDEVMLLAGPVVGALLVSGSVGARLDPVAARVAKIDEQTNGILDQRIAEGVRAALLAHQPQDGPAGAHEGTG